MADLLLLTIGTGTAGRTSNLLAGLRRAIEMSDPERFWLVPSTDEISLLMADEVRSGNAKFAPWSETEPYHALRAPDDLEACRLHLRAMLAKLRALLRPGQKLLVNATSGTKQMTAAAVLAALDEGLGDLVFISGERADGVVKTGTERIVQFDAARFFRERDLASARDLFAAGAFASAAKLLEPHRQALPLNHAMCRTLHHWRRLDYLKAENAAGSWSEVHRRGLATRAQCAASRQPSLLILSDILGWSERACDIGEANESLALGYKALEWAARYALQVDLQLTAPRANGYFELDAVLALARNSEEARRLQALARDGEVSLGLSRALQLLRSNGHPLGSGFFENKQIEKLTNRRNQAVHDIRPVEISEARQLLDYARELVKVAGWDLEPLPIPAALPEEPGSP